MDNEKKAPNENGNHKKHHHGRRKGYFITPADASQPKNVPAQNSSKQSNPPQKNANGEAKKKDSSPAPQRAQNEQSAEAKKNQSTANAQAERPEGKNKGNHKKKRHNRQNRQAESTPASTEQRLEQKTSETPERNTSAPSKKDDKRPQKSFNRHEKRAQTPSFADTKTSSLAISIQDRDESKKEPEPEIYEPVDPADIPSSVLDTPRSVTLPERQITANGEDRTEVVGIRFKSSGKMYYFAPGGKKYTRGTHAIVDTARGQEYGEVAMGNTFVNSSDVVSPLRPVLRAATPADEKHNAENKEKEDEAFKICNEKIIAHKLEMKLIDVQYTFDNSKLLFYFTSAGRVDFRDLVKDLASVFRTRIELRQIGIRDEAKLMGGLGMCGRPLCCSRFLTDFGQVSIKMAKEQNLSLNSAKISGICGRLMCCLRYEHETYEYEIKRTPPVDSIVQTPDGNGVVVEINPLAATVKVKLNVTPEVPPKVYKRSDVTVLQRKTQKSEDE